MKNLRFVIIGAILALIIAAVLVGIKFSQFKAMGDAAAKQVMPPQVVNSILVQKVTWQPHISTIGTVRPVQGTVIRTEVDGVVRELRFDPGTAVEKDDVLVRLDDDVEKTQLRVAKSTAALAQVAFTRARSLIKSRNVSKADFDTAKISLDRANAEVDNIRAIIAKKTIRAPFSGRLGIARISVGEFLDKGSPTVSLQSLDPVYVDFSVPQQRLGQLKRGLRIDVTSDATGDKLFSGRITAIDPNIDIATRYVRVQATLANADELLRPGMFVQVKALLDQAITVLVIPETAVAHAPYGDSVYIIEGQGDELSVQQKFVRLGERRGDYVVVKEGLTEGVSLASTGVFKLSPRMPVRIDNTLAPEFSFDPAPDNS